MDDLLMNKKNTPDLWDKLWDKEVSQDNDVFIIQKEEHSIRWKRILKIIYQQFNSFENLKVIEIGAGKGTYAALMAKKGADVTILDYSDKALTKARIFFKRNNLNANFKKEDALSISQELKNSYDVSMSFGLAEHFTGENRFKIIKAHFDLIKKGGITFISVPNKYNLFYRIWKYIAEKKNRWHWGEEYPFSRRELNKFCKKIKPVHYSFFGNSLFSSIRYFIPETNNSEIKDERGTFLDAYFSVGLNLCMEK